MPPQPQTQTQVYIHPCHPHTPPTRILTLLALQAEEAITLLQRLETALQDPPHPQHRKETFLLATFAPEDSDTTQVQVPVQVPKRYTIALCARTHGTDIDVQLFSSIDLVSPPTSISAEDEEVCAAQVLAILARFRALVPLGGPGVPSLKEESGDGGDGNASDAEDLLILGCVHAHTAAALRARSTALLGSSTSSTSPSNSRPPSSQTPQRQKLFVRDDISGPGGPFNKWIWNVDSASARVRLRRPTNTNNETNGHRTQSSKEHEQQEPLPKGLQWSTVRPGLDRAQVMQWNEYVRSPGVLEGLPCAAIRASETANGEGVDGGEDEGIAGGVNGGDGEDEGGDMVAWAFRSLDGSIRTVHVMEAWRRRGLAGMVVRRVLSESSKNSKDRKRSEESQHSHESQHMSSCDSKHSGAEQSKTQSQSQSQSRPRLGHTNIHPGNVASERLFQSSVGAERRYEVFWMRVDVGVLEGFLGV